MPDPLEPMDAVATPPAVEGSWTKILTAIGIIIAVSNMALAWVVMFNPPMPEGRESPATIVGAGLQERAVASSGAADGNSVAAQSNDTAYREANDMAAMSAKMIAAFAASSEISDAQNHSITVVVLAFSFSALAIGFSLFVMGAQGAFSLGHKQPDLGTLVVKSTSPGLLIIISAAVLMGVVFVARFGATSDPEAEAKAQVIQAEADAEDVQANAKSRILEAEAQLIEARATAFERQAEARARLLEAGLSPDALDRLNELAGDDAARADDSDGSASSGLPGLPGH